MNIVLLAFSSVCLLHFFLSRGNRTGHDLDLLFTCFDHEGQETRLIVAMEKELSKKGLIIWSRIDQAELCLCIFKLPLSCDLEEFVNVESSGNDFLSIYFYICFISSSCLSVLFA